MTSTVISCRARAVTHFGAITIAAIFLLLASAGTANTATAGDAQRTITVSGQGQITATPDQARLSAGVVTQDQSASAALDANTRAMNNVFAAMKRMGIPDNKVRTSTFTLTPQYPPFRPDNPEARTIVGYLVSNQVTVIVNDIVKVGATLDALIRSGANQAYGVVFEIADEKPLLERARRAAVAEAITKARTLADAVGVALGPVLSIQESGGGFEPPAPHALATAAGPPPVSAGEQTVTVNVTAIYSIQ